MISYSASCGVRARLTETRPLQETGARRAKRLWEPPRRFQRRPRIHTKARHMQSATEPPEFSYSVNLSGVSPEEIAVRFADGRMSVYGEHVERFKDANGAMNLCLRGFSNEVNLPPGVGTDALTFSICNDKILKIKAKMPRPRVAPVAKSPKVVTKPHCENFSLQPAGSSNPLSPSGQRQPSPNLQRMMTCCHDFDCRNRNLSGAANSQCNDVVTKE